MGTGRLRGCSGSWTWLSRDFHRTKDLRQCKGVTVRELERLGSGRDVGFKGSDAVCMCLERKILVSDSDIVNSLYVYCGNCLFSL